MALRSWRRVGIGFVVAAAAATTYASIATASVTARAAGAGPIKIGVIAPLTGAFAPIGAGDEQGLLIAEQQINSAGGIDGRKVQLIIKDDQTSPQQSVIDFNALKSDGVAAVFGSAYGDASEAVAPIAQREQMPFITLSPVDKLLSPVESYVFVEPYSAKLQAQRLVQYLKAEKLTKLALVYDKTDELTTDGFNDTVADAPGAGIKVVDKEAVSDTTTDFSSTLTHIKSSGAKAVLVWLTGPPAVVFVKQYHADGYSSKMQLVMTQADSSYDLLVKPAGIAATNGIVMDGTPSNIGPYLPAGPIKRSYESLARAFAKKYGGVPGGFASMGYTGAEILFAALKKAHSVSGAAIDSALQHVTAYEPDGAYRYTTSDHLGASLNDIMIFEVKNGKFVPTAWGKKQLASLPK